MTGLDQDRVKQILDEFRSEFPPGFVGQYRDTLRRYLSTCHLHGPYQTAALLDRESGGERSQGGTHESPKAALKRHLLAYLGRSERDLGPALTAEATPTENLANVSSVLSFLMHAAELLDQQEAS